jgi:hypothetical protein
LGGCRGESPIEVPHSDRVNTAGLSLTLQPHPPPTHPIFHAHPPTQAPTGDPPAVEFNTVIALNIRISMFRMGLLNANRLAGQFKLRMDLSFIWNLHLLGQLKISDGAH